MKQWLRSLSIGERIFWSVAAVAAFGASVTAISVSWFHVLVGLVLAAFFLGLWMVGAEHGQAE